MSRTWKVIIWIAVAVTLITMLGVILLLSDVDSGPTEPVGIAVVKKEPQHD